MAKITKIDANACKELRAILDEKLKNILKDELGITLDFGNGSFNSDSITFKCRVAIEGAMSENDRSLELVKPYKSYLDFDKVAEFDGYKFKIIGYRVKARTKPWLCKDLNSGKDYVLTNQEVDKHFRFVGSIHTTPFPKDDSNAR